MRKGSISGLWVRCLLSVFCEKLRHFFGSIMAENLHISFILGKFLLTLQLDITTVNVNILKTYFIN